MNGRFFARGVFAGLVAAAFIAAAVPAYAQLGTIKGRVVDEAGKPVAGADLTFDFTGELNLHFTGKTDDKGEFIRAGLQAVQGRWNVTAKKGNLAGIAANVDVQLGSTTVVPDIVIREGGAAGGNGEPSAEQKAQAALQKLFIDVKADMAAGSYDDAITKLNGQIAKDEKCSECYLQLGDAYLKKSDADNAEKSYLKAAEIDPQAAQAADAYDALANLYNGQRKFDQAGQMSQKAMAIRGASGGPADATSLFNAGVIFWNQSKIAEAKEQFQKAIQLKPDMAEAQYYYGMCLVNEGNVADAKAALQKYLQLAPTGPNAATAKSILDTMQ
ncbi:MAG TPA: tetratricopeptide repeat protein [Vicinamibacterales bacterium]|jgi:tetratricopeptide (TPR) repeat protein|nr:tetratricopeptide repeat protein [Vicinamibacterales bacterium]